MSPQDGDDSTGSQESSFDAQEDDKTDSQESSFDAQEDDKDRGSKAVAAFEAAAAVPKSAVTYWGSNPASQLLTRSSST